MTLLDVQKALAAKGFDPGPIDGMMGPRTRNAIKAFQSSKGLVADGIVGPKTRGALLGSAHAAAQPDQSVPLDMPWLVEAARLRGLKEGAGAADNPVIMNWADALDASYASDEVPWCGLFVGHCVRSTLEDEPMPANFLGARQWLKYGKSVRPQLGAVMVFWRGSRDGWKGHVAFYWAEDDSHYHILGGNQSNSVNITRIAKSRMLDARWPLSVPAQGIIRTASASGVLISVNEA
jgi:uncharacterized protein (TIGR02594 family)